MTSELRECPFCGGNSSVDRFHNKWFPSCADNETCPAYVVNTPYPTQREAIAAWNTRHRTPDMDGVEAVRHDDYAPGGLIELASRCVTAVEQATTSSGVTKAKIVGNILRSFAAEKAAMADALVLENSDYAEQIAHLSGNAAQADTGKAALVEELRTQGKFAYFECSDGFYPIREELRSRILAALSNKGEA